ncbi:8-oxo-dGTP diphosphatase [Streptococcus suis]|uniref:8-oxo-dGTP diphosphatase n=1 Tax=Streptococcus suis TaxID=1307 RepID=A0A0Z8G9E7_STRSU|nr:8-oxo-dGTP diphosphatase [Streptococcus suis]NQH65210.1 8-oxo-dGTP diphosphatase [Streptococcus suis]NQH77906.1 8-oxo-dGTP diphosphatase [Streptococcus suis]NQO18657.1 8-oxo-dGTP diphosphatase [Streptococcus suis]NQO23269.1 8-oxo-dGTP diphosphatase [Streptococcus suis]RRN50934.1 8-oxo-dGTP diphosphatase [Streptococcus suis]
MSRREQVILTNMCMITDNQRVLVQERKSAKWPGITFPGGHVEHGESIVSSVVREVKEETGLTVFNLELCGIQNWTDPTDDYRYLVFCYKTSHFSGVLQSSDEGEVFWIDREDLKNVQLADGFETMLEIFEQPQLTENFYWFEDGEWKVENR